MRIKVERELKEHKELSPTYQTLEEVPAGLRKAIEDARLGRDLKEYPSVEAMIADILIERRIDIIDTGNKYKLNSSSWNLSTTSSLLKPN